jgi:hypothetical protein
MSEFAGSIKSLRLLEPPICSREVPQSSTARRSRPKCTLAAGDAKSPGSLKAAVERVHPAIPSSQLRWLEGQTHNLAADPAAAIAKSLPGQVMSIIGTPERRMGRAGHQGRSQP